MTCYSKVRTSLIILVFISFLGNTWCSKKTPNYPNHENENVADIDGNVYRIVQIGNQWWMTKNLKVTRYWNGEPIPLITNTDEWMNLSIGASGVYDNKDSFADVYGTLYNWYAVNDPRGLAPQGWHIPSDDEWKTLEMHLGMSQAVADLELNTWRGTVEGGKMKETGTALWNSPNAGATNECGFSALAGGYRSPDGRFHNLGNYAFFWSFTECRGEYAWGRALGYDFSGITRSYYSKRYGFSIRCVRD